jgi:RNA polymerase sigma-70 factor (ECF subfamily)
MDVTEPFTTGIGADDGFSDMLDGARAGVPPACRLLYESLAGRVLGYLRLHGAEDPEDLTSEVFLRVFSHLDEFRGDASGLSAWVFTIAHRALIDERRRHGRRPRTVELTESMPEALSGGNAEADALQGVEDDEVMELLDRLTPDQREVLALRIIADLPIEQVARVLHKRPGTVKALQHRGVAALRRHLEGNDHEV